MFPLRDHNPTEIVPIFTVLIAGATVASWWLLQGAGLSPEALYSSVCALGVVPADVTGAAPSGRPAVCDVRSLGVPTLFTSMFLHGSWGHLIGNLWFLWVFGNNIEDSMGHLRFVAFYLLTGVAAAVAQIVIAPSSPVPMVGASGAISGIMGAYLVLYPGIRIDTWVGFWIIQLPAWLMLGYWMLLQLSGVLGPAVVGGGVAYGAHLGGFIAGLLLIPMFRNEKLVDAKQRGVVLPRSELDHGGWW
ncbi:MAG: rhomboid family intramembrane serine protease [Longimicrobiales bacterium]